MKINGIDIRKYDAKQLTADVQPPSFANSYEWLTGAALRVHHPFTDKDKECKF